MKETNVFTSAARTAATTNSTDFGSGTFEAARFFLNISAVSGTTPSMTVKIQALDNLSGQYVDLPGASFAAKTATGVDMLTIHPAITPIANSAVSQLMPMSWRAVSSISGTTPSFTFSLNATQHT